MDSGNVLEAYLVGDLERLGVGPERKGEINDESPIYSLNLWANGYAISEMVNNKDRQGSCVSQKEGS